MGIKTENPIAGVKAVAQAEISQDVTWKHEKQEFIKQMMSLKSENLKIVRQIHEKDAELSSLNLMKQSLELQLNEIKIELRSKSDDLESANRNANETIQHHKKTVSDLKRENNLLVSQRKQLNAELARNDHQNEKENSFDEDQNVFEVESLLDDKVIAENYYLVRWKGFDSSHDSWVRESNLSCATILKRYKQLQKKT